MENRGLVNFSLFFLYLQDEKFQQNPDFYEYRYDGAESKFLEDV